MKYCYIYYYIDGNIDDWRTHDKHEWGYSALEEFFQHIEECEGTEISDLDHIWFEPVQ